MTTAVAFVAGRVLTVGVLWSSVRDWSQVGGLLYAWDGRWYVLIAEHGYPTSAPTAADGSVVQNELAFLPLYPALVHGVHALTGAPYPFLAVAINTVCSLAAAILAVWLVARYVDVRAAAWGGVFWVIGPGALVMGLAYAEGVYLLGLVVLLSALASGRSGLAAVGLAVAGLSRGAVLPIVVVLVGHLVETARHAEPGRRFRVSAWPIVLLVEAGVVAAAWPVAVWLRTGDRLALARSQSAWGPELAPHLVPDPGAWLVGPHTEPAGWASPRGVLVLLVMAAACVGAVLAWRTSWPLTLRLLAPAFLVFIVLFTPPMMADARYVLPAFTIPVAYAVHVRLLATRAVLVLLLALAQGFWLAFSWLYLIAAP